MQSDGSIRILSYTTSMKDYSDYSGALVYFSVIASEDFKGTHELQIKNIVFTQADETEYNLEPTTTIVTGPANEGEVSSEIPLIIKDSDCGQMTMYVTSGNTAKIKIEASTNWLINNVLFNGSDVTAEIDADGIYTTPEITEESTISISYKNDSSEVEALANDNISISGYNGILNVAGADLGASINIYAVDGKLIRSIVANDSNMEIQLTSNTTYIVVVDGKAVKVML